MKTRLIIKMQRALMAFKRFDAAKSLINSKKL